MRLRQHRRRGATVVECAVIYPLVLFFLIGLIVGAMGIFRYQQVASLAREGARYGAVHGKTYEKFTGTPAATPQEIYDVAIAPNAVGLDPAQLSYSVTWNTSNEVYRTSTVNEQTVATRNDIIVTVTYQWIPEEYLGGITLTSTSVMPMHY
jgi:Flp pilus assembly protein TadG